MLKEQGAVIKSRCLIVLIIEYILIIFQSTKRKNKMNTSKTSIYFVAAIIWAAISVSCSDDAAEEAAGGTVEPTDSAYTGTGEYVDPLFADGTYECYPVGTTWRNWRGDNNNLSTKESGVCLYKYEIVDDTIIGNSSYKIMAVELEKHTRTLNDKPIVLFDGSIKDYRAHLDRSAIEGDESTCLLKSTRYFIREDHGKIYLLYDVENRKEILFYNFNWTEGSDIVCRDELRLFLEDCDNWNNDEMVGKYHVGKMESIRLLDGIEYDKSGGWIKTIGRMDGLFAGYGGSMLFDFSRNGQLVYSDKRLHELAAQYRYLNEME